MTVKTIFQRSQTLKQNAKLSALAMAEYYENRERILKSIASDVSLGDKYLSMSLELPSVGDGVNTLSSVNIQTFVDAIDQGIEEIDVTTYTSSTVYTTSKVATQEVLNSYATSVESASAYGCFFRTIAESIEQGKVEVSNFITSCSSKISNLNSGIVDHLANILKNAKDPAIAIQIAANPAYAPDLGSLVFDAESFGGQNLFISAMSSIIDDIVNVWNTALAGVKQIESFCAKIGAVIGSTISGLIQMFIPNILQDYELNKTPVGIMDVPIASFYVPETDINEFIINNSDVSGYSQDKKYSGLRYRSGSQYYANLNSNNGGWDNFFYDGLHKLISDVDKTGIIEIPVSWGLIRCFKHGGNYYFYLYLQFEGQSLQESEYNDVVTIPNASNQVVCNKIYKALDGLLESMSQYPILSTKPTWPSSDDYNDFIFWYVGDPSGISDPVTRNKWKYKLFIDPDVFTDTTDDDCGSDKLVEAINFKNVNASALNMNGNSKEQIILSYMLFEMCYCYGSRSSVDNTDFGVEEVNAGTLELGDIASEFSANAFVPYYTYASAPTYVHPQTDQERADEIKTIIISVILAAAAAAVSIASFKIKKKLRMKALYKQSVAQIAQWNLGSLTPNDPAFKENMNTYYKARRSASIWSKIAGIAGESMGSTFSIIDENNTLSTIMQLITG